MEDSKKTSIGPGRQMDSEFKIVVHPWRFGQPEFSLLHEEAKAQLFQSLVANEVLQAAVPAVQESSKNLPQMPVHAEQLVHPWPCPVSYLPPWYHPSASDWNLLL